MLSRLQYNITEVDEALEQYRFAESYNKLYHFIWDEVADWYIEANKVQPNPKLLAYVLKSILQLAHPFAPFVTETVWQTIRWTKAGLLISQPRPKSKNTDKKLAAEFEEIKTIVSEIRYITTALDVKYPSLYFLRQPFLTQNADLIKRLAHLSNCTEVEAGRGMHLTQTKFNCWLDIDLNTAQKYVTKLRVNKLNKEATVERLKNRLSNKAYTDKAPAEVIRQTKDQLTDEQALLAKLEQELANFETATDNID
jgi:valyl-tRNA synthetase